MLPNPATDTGGDLSCHRRSRRTTKEERKKEGQMSYSLTNVERKDLLYDQSMTELFSAKSTGLSCYLRINLQYSIEYCTLTSKITVNKAVTLFDND